MGKIYKRLSPKIGLRIKDRAKNRAFFGHYSFNNL